MQNLQTNFNQYLLNAENPSLAYFKTQPGETIAEPVRGTVCILGVGAFVICDILKALAENQHLQAQRLILGPHRDSEKVLSMIKNNKFFDRYDLTSQKAVIENGRTREFFIFDLRT